MFAIVCRVPERTDSLQDYAKAKSFNGGGGGGRGFARGITKCMEAATGISKQSLARIPIRMKKHGCDGVEETCFHPFSLLSNRVARILEYSPEFLEIHVEPVAEDVVASDFLHSQEYKNHPLVQRALVHGGTVLPISVYSDGVAVANDPYQDTLYTSYRPS